MTSAPPTDPSAAVVALKGFAVAKSRLDLPGPLRRRLAWTMAVDTLAALTDAVSHVLVVSDQPALQSRLDRAGVSVEVIDDGGQTGLNAALTRGAAELTRRGHSVVLACVGDLPALRADSVRRVVRAAAAGDGSRFFLADASGLGTTMLVARSAELDPRFSGRSAAAHHASGAVALTDATLGASVPDARRDVDTEVDLMAAADLGLGEATRALTAPGTGRLGQFQVVTATDWQATDGVPLAVTARGQRVRLTERALTRGIRHVRNGQRLHTVTHEGEVLTAWLS